MAMYVAYPLIIKTQTQADRQIIAIRQTYTLQYMHETHKLQYNIENTHTHIYIYTKHNLV